MIQIIMCQADKHIGHISPSRTVSSVPSSFLDHATWASYPGFFDIHPSKLKSEKASSGHETLTDVDTTEIQPSGRNNLTTNCNIQHEKPGTFDSKVSGHVPTCHFGMDRNATDASPVNCCCLQVSHRELLDRDVAEEIMRDEVDHCRENIENKQTNHATCNPVMNSKIHRHEENRTSFSSLTLSDIQNTVVIGSEQCGEILHAVVNATNEHNRYTKGDKFKCDTCNVGFTSLSRIQLHVESHMPGKLYTCTDCGRRVQYFSHLKWHIKNHLEVTKSVKRGKVQNTVMSKHKRGSRSERCFKCDTCNVDLSSLSRLQSHLNIHMSGKLYRCDDCGKKHDYFSYLKRHINSHLKKRVCTRRNSNSKTCYKCNVCSLTVLSRSSLLRHKRKHIQEQAYNSNTGCVDYSSKNVISNPKPAHAVDGTCICDLCGVVFSFRSNLLRHKKLHTKQKPYKCDICGLGFSYSCNMNEHRRSHTGEKPYLCHVCSATFSCRSNLLRHERVHTHEKPFLCDVCGAAFAWRWHLTEHKRVHTGEKPYKCDLCGVKFAAQGHLKKHRVIHTGERNYKCDTCGRKFSRQTNLRSHQRIHKRNHF